jgi:hypothetical protein
LIAVHNNFGLQLQSCFDQVQWVHYANFYKAGASTGAHLHGGLFQEFLQLGTHRVATVTGIKVEIILTDIFIDFVRLKHLFVNDTEMKDYQFLVFSQLSIVRLEQRMKNKLLDYACVA